jgi:hypothetical protein
MNAEVVDRQPKTKSRDLSFLAFKDCFPRVAGNDILDKTKSQAHLGKGVMIFASYPLKFLEYFILLVIRNADAKFRYRKYI